MKYPVCPICKERVNEFSDVVTHTSTEFGCPYEFLGEMIHSVCAVNNGISVPKGVMLNESDGSGVFIDSTGTNPPVFYNQD